MTIILVVGASGSGKDTLIQAARSRFDRELFFARRYITRPPGDHEDNYYISREGFLVLQAAGFFLSNWRAHGLCYGIARSDCFPESGAGAVLASVSRSVIGDFEARFDDVITIQVWARVEVLERRLRCRGRESTEAVRQRLLRATAPVRARQLIPFDNSGNLDASRERFASLLYRLVNCRQTAV
ncbi:MAG: hypothetical protein V2J11_11540 [Desulfofustis sp.]|jgi:ribose 1,5-bisphosphokinase|nr:hypothetical protein [Desulfofustis sp.]